jgi:hypothetical protein
VVWGIGASYQVDVAAAQRENGSRAVPREVARGQRTLASHDPAIYKARVIGDNALNGTRPTCYRGVGTKAASSTCVGPSAAGPTCGP